MQMPDSLAVESPWKQMDVRFRFAAGDMVLRDMKLNCLVRREHFTRVLGIAPQGPHDLPEGVRACYLPSWPIEQSLPRFSRQNGYVRYVPLQYKRHYIDLTGTFEEYLQTFSGKTRSTLKRKVRKFADISDGTIDWRQYRTTDEILEFHAFTRELSAKTYQERLLDCGFPASAAFKECMLVLATEGRARGYLLFHRGVAVSYLYSSLTDGVLMYDHLGYDPGYSEHSPGTVLMQLVLERLFAEGGYRMFDFGQGQGPHKELFSTGSTLCANIYLFPPTMGNWMLMHTHSCVDRFSMAVGKGLQNAGLKSYVKKLIRRQG